MIKNLGIKQIRDLTWYLKWFYNFYFFIIINFFKKELKVYEGLFWLWNKFETWYDIQYLYKRNNIIFYLFLFIYYYLFVERIKAYERK